MLWLYSIAQKLSFNFFALIGTIQYDLEWIIAVIHRIAIFEGDFADLKDNEDFYNSTMVLVCTICAALASGLTIGLMAFDATKLEIKTMIGNPSEIRAARSILPLIKRHHLLLVTLMLFNAAATETMPVFLGALVPNYVAILISVTLVLIFGEVNRSKLTSRNPHTCQMLISCLCYTVDCASIHIHRTSTTESRIKMHRIGPIPHHILLSYRISYQQSPGLFLRSRRRIFQDRT